MRREEYVRLAQIKRRKDGGRTMKKRKNCYVCGKIIREGTHNSRELMDDKGIFREVHTGCQGRCKITKKKQHEILLLESSPLYA